MVLLCNVFVCFVSLTLFNTYVTSYNENLLENLYHAFAFLMDVEKEFIPFMFVLAIMSSVCLQIKIRVTIMVHVT